MNRRDFLVHGRLRDLRAHALRDGASQSAPEFREQSGMLPGLEPYTGQWTYREAAHLLRRCMIGPTDAEIRQAVADGMEATVAKLLTPFDPSYSFIADWQGQDPMIRPTDATQAQAFLEDLNRKKEGLSRWWHMTIQSSPVSIQERMVVFWHGHFTSEIQVVNISEWMLEQNKLFRSRMLGNFKEFVVDVTRDMAMLVYLDGIKNYKAGARNNINENYSRELMELYTCGVADWEGNPNYTQQDVSEAARALSGWTATPSAKGQNYAGLKSQFASFLWDSGQKTIMGQTGAWKDDDVVDIIFAQRADQVAKFICGKIYRAFVYDQLDAAAVTQMAETFRTGNWEIRPVMEQLLKSAHFYDESNIGAMEKSPLEYIAGMVRGLGLTGVPDLTPSVSGRGSLDMAGRMGAIGMVLGDPPDVKGWRAGRTWVSTSTLPYRQKFAIDVSKGAIRIRGAQLYIFDPIAFAKRFPDYNSLRKLNDNMAQFLLNTQASDPERQRLLDTLVAGGASYEWDIDDPDQKADERIRKFLEAVVQLAKHELY